MSNKDKSKGKKALDIINPNVIDKAMIIEAVQEWQTDNNIITNEQIQLSLVQELSLSFKSLKSIQNLDGLQNLVKLQLDNNNIVKIEGLGHLVNLRWLDLSFNAIESSKQEDSKDGEILGIQGLEKLVNLEDLSLFNNFITKIGNGLNNCQKLNVLSIGNNKLENVDELIQILGSGPSKNILNFRNLQVLNIRGNPFSQYDNENEYKHLLIMSLPGLKYLDYTFIDKSDRESIINQDTSQKFTAEMRKNMYDYESNVEEKIKEENNHLEEKKKRSEANMDLLQDFQHKMCDENEDLKKFMKLNETLVKQEIEKFKGKIKEALDEIQLRAIAQHKVKIDEQSKFLAGWRDRIQSSERETIEVIVKFEKTKKRVFKKFEEDLKAQQDEDKIPPEIFIPLTKLLESTQSVKEQLMQIEMSLVSDLEIAAKGFSDGCLFNNDEDLGKNIAENQKKIEASLSEFQAVLTQIGKAEQEKDQQLKQQQGENNQQDDDEDEERQQLLEKDSMQQILNQIHEALKDRQQLQLTKVQTTNAEKNSQLKINLDLQIYERNRRNLEQILNQIEKYNSEIQKIIDSNQNDQDND